MIAPLKDYTTKIGSGSTPTGGNESYKKSGITLIRSMNVHDFNFDYKGLAFIDDDQAYKLRSVTVEQNDLLLNITGASVARCCIVPESILPARVNQHVSIIRVNSKKANVKYLLYYLNSPSYKNYLLGLSGAGATREALTKEVIENLKIPFPPIGIQQKIASILSAYDELVENNKQRIKLLEETAEEIYKEWFVRLRFPGYKSSKFFDTDNKEVTHAAIGAFPDGWSWKKVEEVFKTSSGGTPSRVKESEYYNGVIDWIKTGELKDTFILDSEEKITESGLKNSSAKLFPPNTLLMAMYGVNIGQLGISVNSSSANQAVCVFTPINRNEYSLYYTFFYFKSIRAHLFNISMGAAQQNLSQDIIKQLDFLMPTAKVINSYESVVKSFFEEIKILSQKNQILQQTRDLLLPRLISGKLSVEHLIQEAEILSLAAEPTTAYENSK